MKRVWTKCTLSYCHECSHNTVFWRHAGSSHVNERVQPELSKHLSAPTHGFQHSRPSIWVFIFTCSYTCKTVTEQVNIIYTSKAKDLWIASHHQLEQLEYISKTIFTFQLCVLNTVIMSLTGIGQCSLNMWRKMKPSSGLQFS
jgi:hypothetical protein